MDRKRTSAKNKAKQLAKLLRHEHPDYNYLKSIFRFLKDELDIKRVQDFQRLPYVPTEEEIRLFYNTVWQSKNFQDMLIIKTFLYTGIRVSELINIMLNDIDLERCQIRINNGKGSKDRIVPFPKSFKELLAMHLNIMQGKRASYLFESSWKRKYSDRGIRKIISRYKKHAGLSQPISPHRFRHFILTWLKKQGIDDAFIQPYSGHENRKSLEIYSKLAITDAQKEYDKVIENFPI